MTSPGLIWTLPGGVPTGGSLLTFSAPVSNVSTLTYTALTASGGILLTPSTGYLNIGLGSNLTDAAGDTLLSFSPGAAGSASHVQVSNSSSGAPAITAVGGSPSTSLDLSDSAGGGVSLISNGSPALVALNSTSGNVNYATAIGAAAGGPVILGAANSGATGSISLELQPQGTGFLISSANLDIKGNALISEIPVNPAGNGVTQRLLVILDGTAAPNEGADTWTGAAPTHGVIGVGAASTTVASGAPAEVAYSGTVICAFDTGGVVFNHYVTAGAAGQCHDSGTSATIAAPLGAQIIGVSLADFAGHGGSTIMLRLGN